MKIAIFTKDGALPRELGRFSGVDVYPITANGFTASATTLSASSALIGSS